MSLFSLRSARRLRRACACIVMTAGLLFSGCGRHEEPEPSSALPKAVKKMKKVTLGLWVNGGGIIQSRAERDRLIDFCRLKKIQTLYFSVGEFADRQYDTQYMQDLRAFVQHVHDNNMTIHALNDVPDSARLARKEHHYEAFSYVKAFLTYNQAQRKGEQFDGFLEQIQPQTLEGWADNEGGIHRAFVDLVHKYRLAVVEFGPGTPLGWVLPVAFDTYGWLEQVYEDLDYVVLLNAHDDRDGLVLHVTDELSLAAETKTRVIVCVETSDLVSAGLGFPQQTFFEEGGTRMEAVLKDASKTLKQQSAFGGIAVRSYRAYFTLAPEGRPSAALDQGS